MLRSCQPIFQNLTKRKIFFSSSLLTFYEGCLEVPNLLFFYPSWLGLEFFGTLFWSDICYEKYFFFLANSFWLFFIFFYFVKLCPSKTGVNNSQQIPSSFVHCHAFSGKIMDWLHVALSTVGNSVFLLFRIVTTQG